MIEGKSNRKLLRSNTILQVIGGSTTYMLMIN